MKLFTLVCNYHFITVIIFNYKKKYPHLRVLKKLITKTEVNSKLPNQLEVRITASVQGVKIYGNNKIR